MSRKDCNLQTRLVKPSKENEKKIKKSKEKTATFKNEKKIGSKEKAFKVEKYKTLNKKNFAKKINNKKYQLAKRDPLSDATSDEEENCFIENNIESSENESETETENEPENDSTTDVDNESGEEFAEAQPFFINVSQKRKKPQLVKQNTVKKSKQMKKKQSPPTAIFEGWEADGHVPTKEIDFTQWQSSHPNRETFFVGPDKYIYNNASSMKKFVDALKKNRLDEKIVSIPIKPMSKVVATNPRITVGVTGSRYILQNGGGYGVSPIFFIAKEYVS